MVLLPLIVRNLRIINGKEKLGDGKVLEGLSMRTMLIDHLISFLYIAAFIVVGLSSSIPKLADLAMIVITGIVVFLLEALSAVLQKQLMGAHG